MRGRGAPPTLLARKPISPQLLLACCAHSPWATIPHAESKAAYCKTERAPARGVQSLSVPTESLAMSLCIPPASFLHVVIDEYMRPDRDLPADAESRRFTQ